MRGAVAVGGHVQRLVVVQQLEDVRRRRGVDDRGRDELVHGLVVRRLGRVVHQPRAAAVDGAREEGHAQRFLVRDALEGADQVGALKVLGREGGFVSYSIPELPDDGIKGN